MTYSHLNIFCWYRERKGRLTKFSAANKISPWFIVCNTQLWWSIFGGVFCFWCFKCLSLLAHTTWEVLSFGYPGVSSEGFLMSTWHRTGSGPAVNYNQQSNSGITKDVLLPYNVLGSSAGLGTCGHLLLHHSWSTLDLCT